MTEIFCEEIVFHFNKKNLQDPAVPMWTLKTKGQSLYVSHVSCECPWTTKETPDNQSTKGSIKVKNALLIINDFNEATLRPATSADKARLKGECLVRVGWLGLAHSVMKEFLQKNEIATTEWKNLLGGCGSSYWITDVLSNSDVVQMELALWGKFRRLQPNEPLYRGYDSAGNEGIDDDDEADDDEVDEGS